jgi:hypothetical protein
MVSIGHNSGCFSLPQLAAAIRTALALGNVRDHVAGEIKARMNPRQNVLYQLVKSLLLG